MILHSPRHIRENLILLIIKISWSSSGEEFYLTVFAVESVGLGYTNSIDAELGCICIENGSVRV